MSFRIDDAPAADEILVVVAAADGGRPQARVGGLQVSDIKGEEGLA